MARSTIDKLDGILVDLRKLGFSLITGLFTAQGFLGYTNASDMIRLSIIIATMGLVIILFWIDKYYYSLLLGAYARSRQLEVDLHMNLSRDMAQFLGISSHTILNCVYFGFLFILYFLGLVAIHGNIV